MSPTIRMLQLYAKIEALKTRRDTTKVIIEALTQHNAQCPHNPYPASEFHAHVAELELIARKLTAISKGEFVMLDDPKDNDPLSV